MNLPVGVYIPPREPVAVMPNVLTPEECQATRDLGVLLSFDFTTQKTKKAKTQTKANKGTVGNNQLDLKVRDSNIVWFEPAQHTEKWFNTVFSKIDQAVAYVNFLKFQLDLRKYDGVQFTEYEAKGHYDWHVDVEDTPSDGLFRKLSLVLMLSKPEEYDGGELLLNLNGNSDKADGRKMNQGDLVLFYSDVPHKVSPVTKGARYTLVTWMRGPKIS